MLHLDNDGTKPFNLQPAGSVQKTIDGVVARSCNLFVSHCRTRPVLAFLSALINKYIDGIDVASIIDEPTAAAIAYELDMESGQRNVLVFNLGGRIFDVSEDFDQRILEYLIKLINKKYGKDISSNSDVR
ncbi:Luminal-binding protein 4 [Linum grandiflorum]